MIEPKTLPEVDERDAVREPDRIPVAGPWVTDLEVQYVAEAAANDWYTHAGESVGRFETEFAGYLGTGSASAVPHCTSALHLAMLALDVGPGDEVIVPESTWVATAAPITYVGATPVFADIDADTWCLSTESLARCVSTRTAAVVTVDLYGGIPDMAAVRSVAGRIPIIEDAAQAIGGKLHGRFAGTLGDIGTFSFHGTKTLTTGEGGMVVTDRGDLAERIQRLRDHGRTPSDHRYFTTEELAYKYRMSSLQAAFGRAQLSRIDELLDKKRQIFEWYEERLADVPGVDLNHRRDGLTNTFWMVTAVVDSDYRLTARRLMELFDLHSVDTRPFLPPLSSLPAFARYQTAVTAARRNKTAYDIAARSINLPSALMLTEEQVDRVCDVLHTILRPRKERS
ncbi:MULTISPECIES: DegT/DnrJ/EryC1/StrS family aminotransferase [Rhodococcus]|uniref:DegT/DnrJ/EryC1/StrS family aminotransferase n=1 Tax=Rhodococcus pseudokoreensis TaxID=2811421 RepID=A0A974W3J5_9NOCA|nr:MULTISPECIES: DegT/DnrJ/EryC1/StrS family aminotransferase [Rhodococcus]MBV6761366.1 DegT/DnrJ/EryC1/StrS family aminotransferase [Rhodococcus opacus]QSE89992.1 DegT/DnrJ/EryC1/StrS family aminotransferase [Rhodococcus pseudokoreensis]